MSRKLLIGWCIMPISLLISPFIHAQTEQITVFDYFLYHNRTRNFSVEAILPKGNVALYSQNQFLLKELCATTISGSYNIKGNAVALTLSHFGYSKYGIFTISSGYARVFAKRISFGLQVHYLMHHAGEYPKKHSFTFDLSLYGQITQKIGIGVSAYNPANLKYGLTGKEKIPILYILIFNYKINDKVLLAIAGSKQLPGFFDITGTACFRDRFYGFMTHVSLKKAGVICSFWWKRFRFDIGGSFDYRLGFSPEVGVNYQFTTHAEKMPYLP